jgi:hypothetical protein
MSMAGKDGNNLTMLQGGAVMPVVFVHGVSTRDDPGDDEYAKRVRKRDRSIRGLLMSDDPAHPYAGRIENPYWGKHGAKFAFGMASLPAPGGGVTLGPEALIEDLAVGGIEHPEFLLARVAQQSLLEAVDLVLVLAMETAQDANDADLLRLARTWADWASSLTGDPPRAEWAADGMTNDAFLAALQQRVEAWAGAQPAHVTLGGGVGSALGKAAAGVSRLAGDLRNVVSRAALRVARDSLHDKVALFVGDVFEYLHKRGQAEVPGDIVSEVIASIDAVASQRSANDPLILIGHSLGGVILYDILTHFLVETKPDWEADALVTVGSQVGLFEEMKQFHASVEETGSKDDRTVKAIAPAAKVWINIYDEVDVFSFQAEPIFDKVEDFRFSSRTGVLSAHSAYFLRPTLYRRLRRRLIDAGVPLP